MRALFALAVIMVVAASLFGTEPVLAAVAFLANNLGTAALTFVSYWIGG